MQAENRISVSLVKRRLSAAMPWISLFVVLLVFWWLKLTGITLAGEAFCGIPEHTHTDACFSDLTSICALSEHTHTSDCYSDITADVETREEWEATLPLMDKNTSTLNKILYVACSQIGYKESETNFKVDENLVRHGYTRYGDWYGNPYADWSTCFVSFCLYYADMRDLPMNAGAEVMKIEWEFNGRFGTLTGYSPQPGDVVFLDKDHNGRTDASAIFLTSVSGNVSVVEGDVDGEVKVVTYQKGNRALIGYGISAPSSSLIVKPDPTPTVNTTPADEVPKLMSSNKLLSAVAKDTPQTFAAPSGKIVASAVAYSTSIFSGNNIVVYTSYGTNLYAFDGNGNAVPITVGDDGIIRADIDDPNLILWTFEKQGSSGNNYLIRNVSTGLYMHAYPANGSGVVTSGAYSSTLVSTGGNVKIRSNSEYARLDTESGTFVMTQDVNAAANYSFGISSECYVWLDGTNGGLMSLGGSPNICYTVSAPSSIQLPSEWQSPEKYGYRLQGWYDVSHGVYYKAGEYVTITGNTVFYADWVAATYDIGTFNAQACDTVSTNHIITTRVFDFNYLFNVMSQNVTVNVNGSTSHSESWSHVSSGTVPYKNSEAIDFVFVDNDSGGKISMANNRNSNNKYESNVAIKPGILTPEIEEIVFGTDNSFNPDTGEGIIGKTYLGTGDYLFQYMNDPNSKYYGYYYYDSNLHAASYNQSQQRFYVYDYLVRTSDSASASGNDKYADFLPFNSPYANTNGKIIPTYTYNGDLGEYVGTQHYQFDAKYNQSGNSTNNVAANLASGISMEMKFYLPDTPGSLDENGNTGNRDLYGNEMVYEFAGDDDLWVLVDGEVILDLGGIHGSVEGIINFSTGIVTAEGEQTNTLYDLAPGEHTFTVYYLERGSSQSNCSMFFNIAPRFSLDIFKEDVLTEEVLNGAEFTVYTDSACTVPAFLWDSKTAYESDLPTKSTFRVTDGVAKIWGMSPGKNYYIKETKAPDAEGYDRSEGIICLSFDIKGIATFEILIDEESPGDGITGGYTVHSYKVDTENQAAYMTVTNAQDWVKEITSVQAVKTWNDSVDHSSHYVTVYLSIKDPDGTIRRIREAVLGEENDWMYTWTNLPKYAADGVTPIEYIIEESYFPGYTSTVEQVDEIVVGNYRWDEAANFVNGQKYLLKTPAGYISANSASTDNFKFISEEQAMSEYDDPASLSAWTATVSGNNVKLTNGIGQIISYNTTNSNRYFFLKTSSGSNQSIAVSQTSSGVTLSFSTGSGWWKYTYYMTSTLSSGYLSVSTSSSSALTISPMIREGTEEIVKVKDLAYKVTNTPITKETSLKVTKHWDRGLATNVYYDNLKITVKLFANGKDTGRTLTLSLKNGWTDSFRGLPYEDENGVPIVYTIGEGAIHEDWEPFYGEVITVPGTVPTYETTVTNVYRYGHGYELPSTGGIGRAPLILCGLTLMIGSLVCGCVLNRKRERRRRE